MTFEYGIGMFFYGMGCVFIGAIITYYVINKVHKTPEELEAKENEDYLKELKKKL